MPTFTCKCGEFDYPLEDTEDESVWCPCGLRIDQQREIAQLVASTQ